MDERYFIARGNSLTQLQNLVNKKMEEGWQPHSQLVAIVVNQEYVQPMVRWVIPKHLQGRKKP